MKTEVQKAAKKASKARAKALKAADMAKSTARILATTPAAQFEPAMTAEEFWNNPLLSSAEVLKNRSEY